MNHAMFLRRLVPTALLLFLSLPAAAADTFDGPEWALLEAGKVTAVAATITTNQYPDCDEATVDARMIRVVHADGTGARQDESFTKVLTEKGKRNNRTASFSFMLPYFTVEVVRMEVIKPDGRVVPVDLAANSKEAIDDSQMGANIYDPNLKVLRVNVPDLEVGDLLHAISRTRVVRAIMAGESNDNTTFEYPGLIKHTSYEVRAPADKPLKRIALKDEVPGTVTASTETAPNGTLIYRWDVHDVPRMFDEPGMPPYSMVLQRLVWSTSPDWPTVSRWYAGVCQPHLDAVSPAMQETLAGLTNNAATDLDRIKAIFYYVSQKIRYMGITPEKDRPGFEPHDVQMTFANKYGVCRDKAALLVSMLRLAGYPAYPVLVSAGLRKDDEVPDPDFNHAIVCVEFKTGEYTLMDPTDENTKELLPSYLCHQSYLVCKPGGEALRLSPIIPPEDNLLRVKTTATLDANGRMTGKSELIYEGINDNIYRMNFARMKPDEHRRFFESRLKNAMPGARLVSLKLTPENMLDVSVGLRAELEFAAEGMIARGQDRAVASVPWLGETFGIVNFVLQGTGLEKRRYPLNTEVACGTAESLEIRLGEGFGSAVSLPQCPAVKDDCLEYERSLASTNRTLTGTQAFKLKVVEFSPTQYLKLKETLKNMEYDRRKAPVLAVTRATIATVARRSAEPNPPVDSDFEVLAASQTVKVVDAHSAVTRVKTKKRVLTYNGKKEEAEVKIPYNPAVQEVKLISAAVTSATGQRQEVATQEINLMDAGWNASARRYTGGKILVVNLPGVDLGSTIETEYEIRSKNRPFLGGFDPFQTESKMDSLSLELTVPDKLAARRWLTGPRGSVAESRLTVPGATTFQWRATNVAALPNEAGCPPAWAYLPGVAFGVGDPTAYWHELDRVLRDRSNHRPAAAAQAAKLTGPTRTKRDAVIAIRDFVAKSIRTAGPGFLELPLSELSAADTTLADGYGHAADKAILLHAMLSAAGFKPEFVLVSGIEDIPSLRAKVAAFPLPYLFDGVLVKVRVDGEAVYLNDTDQYARLGTTASAGHLAFRPADRAFEMIRPAKGCGGRQETDFRFALAADGKTRITIANRFYGSAYNGKRRFFAELPPEERRRYYQELVSGVVQGARPVGELATQFDRYPGVEEFTVEVDRFAVVDNAHLFFQVPYRAALFNFRADHRQLPIMTGRNQDRAIHARIQWRAGFPKVVIAPRSQRLWAPAGAGVARVDSNARGNAWQLDYSLKSSPALIPAEKYPALIQLETALGELSSRAFLLERN